MKIVIFYYTQSGQALKVAQSIGSAIGDVVYKEIVPDHTFPFPWSRREFFDVFPETRLGIPPFSINEFDLSDVQDANAVMVVGQSWFLSPSLPLQAFFRDADVRNYLRGRDVIFVNVCRNMWMTTWHKVRGYICDIGAYPVGHIVMQDRHPNIVSALTIVRWLMFGRKEKSLLLPEAGVSACDINNASSFGEVISNTYKDKSTDHLQERLMAAGAICYKPSIAFIERKGHYMFGIWARWIIKKGRLENKSRLENKRRRFWLNVFYVYLLFVLFVVSPFGQLFFWINHPFRRCQIDDSPCLVSEQNSSVVL